MKKCLHIAVEPKCLRELLVGSCVSVLFSIPTPADESEYTTVPAKAPAAAGIPRPMGNVSVQANDVASPPLDIDAEVLAIRELRRRGEVSKARTAVVALVANLEQRKIAVPSDIRLLEGRLHIEHGRALPQEGNRHVVFDPKRGAIVEIVNPAKDEYRQAGDALRVVVAFDPNNMAAWVLFLRAAVNEALPTANAPLDRTQMQWVHDSAKQLLRSGNLTRQEQAQLHYLLGLAHFDLPCGTDRGRGDFAESQRLFPSHQAEKTLYGLDGILLVSTRLPDLWEPVAPRR